MNRIDDNYASFNDNLAASHSRHYSYPRVIRDELLGQGSKTHDSVELARKAAYRRIRIQLAPKQDFEQVVCTPERVVHKRTPTSFVWRYMRLLALPIYAT